MPKKLHQRLAQAASKKGLSGKSFDSYVYGTMQRILALKKRKKQTKKSKRLMSI